jgi:hypothetical protein
MAATSRTSVRDLAQSLLDKERLERADVDVLLSRAMEEGRLTSRARGHIRSVIEKFEEQDASAEAVRLLRSFLDIRGDALRAAHVAGAAEKSAPT